MIQKVTGFQKNPEANDRPWPIAMWFTSDNLCVAGEVQDISNPAKAPTERKWEFKSSHLLVLSVLEPKEPINGRI